MTTTTSLTFFTAIFLALSGALAEELMVIRRMKRLNYIDSAELTYMQGT